MLLPYLDWSNPNKQALAALRIAQKQKTRYLNEVETAEFIYYADSSLWFTQAKSWLDKPPVKDPSISFKIACKYIVQIVANGYDGEADEWWVLKKTWPDKAAVIVGSAMLMDFGQMLDQIQQNSPMIISQGFGVFIEIICGKNWRSKFKKVAPIINDYFSEHSVSMST